MLATLSHDCDIEHTCYTWIIPYGGKFSRVAIFADVEFWTLSLFNFRGLALKTTPPIGCIKTTPLFHTYVPANHSMQSVKHELCLNYEAVLWRRRSMATTSIRAFGRLKRPRFFDSKFSDEEAIFTSLLADTIADKGISLESAPVWSVTFILFCFAKYLNRVISFHV